MLTHLCRHLYDRSPGRESSASMANSVVSREGSKLYAWSAQPQSSERGSATELDKIDAQLLDLVQRNNRLTSEQLSALVGLSASGVQRRLKRLRSDGVIEADISI